MVSIDPSLTELLLEMAHNDERPSLMLRAIIAHFAPKPVDQLDLFEVFTAAFSFTGGEGNPIFGWSPDGTGELKDADIDRILSRRIRQTAAAWTHAQSTISPSS